LRVLHIDTGRELRGGQRQVLFLLQGLREAGVQSTLLAHTGSPLFQNAAALGFPVFPATLRILRDQSKLVDIVHAHEAHGHTSAALCSRAPFVVSRRVAFPIKRSLLSEWKYRQASRYLAVSQFVASELARSGISNGKIDLVYDCVQPVITPAVWSLKEPAVALASRDPAKGRDLVTKAARLANFPVVYSDDLPKDLLRASMFIYITLSEGLGSATLLSMAMGVPVIASDIGGLSEALAHGQAGLLTSNDPVKIAAAINRLREDPALGMTLIERGKNHVAEFFTMQHMVESTLASYRSALAA